MNCSFDQIIFEVLKDFFQGILIDWEKNIFDENGIELKKRQEIEISNILIFNGSLTQNLKIFYDFFCDINENKVNIINAISFDHQDLNFHNDQTIFYKKGDWPFKLSSFDLILSYFNCFENEDEIYKFLTLSFYSLKEKRFFLSIFFGSENLKEFRLAFEDFKDQNFFEGFKLPLLDPQKILHNLQKVGFRNPVLLNEKFSLKFNSFEKFFEFLKSENIMHLIFSEHEILMISEKKNELINFLNLYFKRDQEDSMNLEFETCLISSET